MTPADTLTIKCPKCHAPIKLTEVMAAPLLEAQRAALEQEIRGEAQQAADRAASGEITKAWSLAEGEKINARKLAQDLALKESQLAEAQKTQAEFLRKERELNDRARELDLTIERRLNSELVTIRSKAQQEATDAARLEVVAKDEQLASMARTIEELKQKASQGSQQLQGEAQEIELETLLRSAFPQDRIDPVAKGVFGGDILQTVVGPTGQVTGKILWESKRTKTFASSWLPKLRDDCRAAKADVALLVTQALPADWTGEKDGDFGMVDGVWVIVWKQAVPVARMIRSSLLELASVQASQEGIETKAKTVYRYLTGPTFRQRVQAVIEKSERLRDGLEKERRAMTTIWAAREKDIQSVVEHMSGMYGELTSLAGAKLPEIEGLKLEAGS